MKQLTLSDGALSSLRLVQLKRICCFADPGSTYRVENVFKVYCNNSIPWKR